MKFDLLSGKTRVLRNHLDFIARKISIMNKMVCNFGTIPENK